MKKTSLLVYIAFLLGATSSLSFNPPAQNVPKENTSDTSYNVPSISVDTKKEASGMSKAINALASAQEILFGEGTLSITLDSAAPNDVLTIAFSSLDVDLSGINALNLNLSGSLTLSYKGLSESLTFRYESNQYVYLIFKGNSLKFKAPKTIGDVAEMIRALGLPISNASSSITISEILTQVSKLQTNVKAMDSGTGNKYQLIVPSLTFGDTSTNEITLDLVTDENNTPISLSTDSDLEITAKEDDNTSKTTKISFSSPISSLKSTSTYNHPDEEAYQDVTAANSSLFGTIEHIFSGNYTSETKSDNNKKSAVKVNIEGTVSNTETDSSTNTSTVHSSLIEGSLSADMSDVFIDENAGTYSLSLTQKPTKDSTETYNTLSAYFNKSTTYIALNNLFKGRIQDSSISTLFQQISRITDKPVFSSITDDFNILLKKASSNDNFAKLTEGDYSGLDSLLKSYEYSPTHFLITLSGSFLGLDNDVSLEVTFVENDGEKDIQSLTVTGLKYGSLSLDSLTLSLDTYTAPTAPVDSDYSDYSGISTLFKNVADLFDQKKLKADYKLIYTDSSSYTFNASGAIGADLSSATIDTSDDGLTETLHPETGTYYLSFDLARGSNTSTDNKEEIYALGQGLESYYNPSDKHLYFGYEYTEDPNFTDGNDKYLFRNSIANTDINEIVNLIKEHAAEDSSTDTSLSLLSMSTYLDAILSSDKFTKVKDGIKSLSLAELDGVVSVSSDSNDNGKVIVTLDPSTFLTGSKYASNSGNITITLGSDGSFVAFSANGKINGSTIDFTLDLGDYSTIDVTKYTTTNYPEISTANQMISSLFALPTDLKQFDMTLEGEVSKDSYVDGKKKTDQPLLQIVNTDSNPTGASVDLTSTFTDREGKTQNQPKLSGIVNLKNPSLNDTSKYIDGVQKLEFNYEGSTTKKTTDLNGNSVYDAAFVAEYNDHMHINAKTSDLYDIVKGIKNIPEANLLWRYVKFMNDTSLSTGSALMDLMNGKSLGTSKLLANPYIENIEFSSDATIGLGNIAVTFNVSLLTSSVDSSPITVAFSYTTGSDCHITKATVTGDIKSNTTDTDTTNDTTYHVYATLGLEAGSNKKYERTTTTDTSLTSTGNNILTYTSSNSSAFVDVNGFKVLGDCLIDTTENNFFEIEGILQVSLSVIGIDITDRKVYCYAAIYVQDETAYAYLRFKPYDKSIRDDGFYGTEFFIQEQKVLVNRITTELSSRQDWFKKYYTFKSTAEYYKTTAANIESNLVYYILDYIMDLKDYTLLKIKVGSKALNSIYSSMNSSSSSSSATINDDLSQVLTSAIYSSNTFTMNLALNNLLTLSGVRFSDTKVVLTHQAKDSNGKKPLKSISIDTKITAYSVLNVTVSSGNNVNTFTLAQLSNKTIDQAKAGEMSRFFNFWTNYERENGAYDATTTSMYLISKVESAGSPTYTGDVKTHTESKENSSSGDKTNNIPYISYWYFAGANF